MSFTVTDFHDLTRLLYEHPDWRAEMRRLVLSDEILELPALVRQLAEAQSRSEERLSGVEERLSGVEERLSGVEERLSRVEAALERLAEAQKRTEQSIAELGDAQRGLATAVGQLNTAFGASIEEEAESVIQTILERKGYRLLAEPLSLIVDGEVDVVMPMRSPEGERVWLVAEAKARLGRRQVRDWAQRIRSSGWQGRLAARGVPGPYLVYVYGIRIDPKTEEEAKEQGIGLATGRGERLPPTALVRPPSEI